jgi:hypothetical protein
MTILNFNYIESSKFYEEFTVYLKTKLMNIFLTKLLTRKSKD